MEDLKQSKDQKSENSYFGETVPTWSLGAWKDELGMI